MSDAWLVAPGDKYGGSLAAYGQATKDDTGVTSVAPTPVHSAGGLFHPSEPLFAFAALTVLMLALATYSTAHVE